MRKHNKNEETKKLERIVKSIDVHYEKPVTKDNLRNKAFHSVIVKISPFLNKNISLSSPLSDIFCSTNSLKTFVLELAKSYNVDHKITKKDLEDMDFEAFNNHYRYIWYYIYGLIITIDKDGVHSPRVTRAKVRRNLSLEAKMVMEEAGVPFYDDEIPLSSIFRNEQDLMLFVLSFSQRCHTVFDPNEFARITFQKLQTIEDLINLLEPRVLLYLSFSSPSFHPPHIVHNYTKVESLYTKMAKELKLSKKHHYDMPLRVMFKDNNSLLKFIKHFLISFDIIPTPNEHQTILEFGFDLFGHSKCLMAWLTEKIIKNNKID